MISPMTPAGTKVVCIDNTPVIGLDHRSGGLTKGEIYTVFAIIPNPRPNPMTDYCVILKEIDRSKLWAGNFEPGFHLNRFRRLITPEDFVCSIAAKELENV